MPAKLDPLAVVADPDKLYKLTELAEFSREYRYGIPTVTTKGNRELIRPVALTEEDSYFSTLCDALSIRREMLLELLKPFAPNCRLVCAGGAAAAPFYAQREIPSDVDFFILDESLNTIESPSADTISALYRHVQKVAMEFIGGDSINSVIISKGVLTLHRLIKFDNRRANVIPLQFVLSSIPSVQKLLSRFDIGASSIAVTVVDGALVCELNALGAFAMLYGVNILIPKRLDRNFGARCGKYFNRGFDIGLPHLKLSDDYTELPAETLQLSHMRIDLAARGGNRLVAERLQCQQFKLATETDGDAAEADNSPRDFSPYISSVDINRVAVLSHEARETALHGINASALYYTHRLAFVADLLHTTGRHFVWKPDIPRTLPDLFEGRKFPEPAWVWHPLQLAAQYAMTFEEALEAIRTAALTHGRRRVELGDGPWRRRAAFREELWRRTEIEFGFEFHDDQHGPMRMTVAEVYGEHPRLDLLPPASTADPEATIAALESERAMIECDTCSICMQAMVPGAKNTMRLHCGHSLHVASDNRCEGGVQWIRDKRTCPQCRAHYNPVVSAEELIERQRAPGGGRGVENLPVPDPVCTISATGERHNDEIPYYDRATLADLLKRTRINSSRYATDALEPQMQFEYCEMAPAPRSSSPASTVELDGPAATVGVDYVGEWLDLNPREPSRALVSVSPVNWNAAQPESGTWQ